MAKWDQLRKEVLIENPWFQISKDVYELPDSSHGEYTYIDIPGSTMIIPVLDSGQLVLGRQYRYLMQRQSLEFPAGGLKKGYSPLAGAQEELLEEVGYEASSWTKIGQFAPYNGVANEYCHVFVARDLKSIGKRLELTEEIHVEEFSLSELQEQVRQGELWDGMTITCIALYESQVRE